MDVIRVAGIDGYVLAVFCQEAVNRLLVLFFRYRVILIRHADVRQDIRVTDVRYDVASRYLGVLVRVGVDDLELLCAVMPVALELPSGEVAAFEGDVYHLLTDHVFIRIEGQILVLDIIDGVFLPVLICLLLGPYRGYRTQTVREYILKGRFLAMLLQAQLGVQVDILVP